MRTDFEPSESYLRGCIKSCQEKGHIQQVAFSTYHDALTQVCFTCEVCRTSINQAETKGSKKGKPLSNFVCSTKQGCGKVFKQDKDFYIGENGRQETKSICGKTFDEKGIDLCPKCRSSTDCVDGGKNETKR